MIEKTANDRQVGGEHYKTGGIELWDLFGPEALVFYALRYVQRWRKKNGVQDLEKALHICEKLCEVWVLSDCKRIELAPYIDDDTIGRWIVNSGMEFPERSIANILLHVRSKGNIFDAIAGIRYLIEWSEERKKIAPRQFIPVMEQGINNEERERGIFVPWQIDRATHQKWGEGSAVRHAAMAAFYKQVAPNIYRLEPYVEARCPSPVEWGNCYFEAVPNCMNNWLLRIDEVPPKLRENYPVLRTKINAVEWSELPPWQRDLYEWRKEGQQYALRAEHAAWSEDGS